MGFAKQFPARSLLQEIHPKPSMHATTDIIESCSGSQECRKLWMTRGTCSSQENSPIIPACVHLQMSGLGQPSLSALDRRRMAATCIPRMAPSRATTQSKARRQQSGSLHAVNSGSWQATGPRQLPEVLPPFSWSQVLASLDAMSFFRSTRTGQVDGSPGALVLGQGSVEAIKNCFC